MCEPGFWCQKYKGDDQKAEKVILPCSALVIPKNYFTYEIHNRQLTEFTESAELRVCLIQTTESTRSTSCRPLNGRSVCLSGELFDAFSVGPVSDSNPGVATLGLTPG